MQTLHFTDEETEAREDQDLAQDLLELPGLQRFVFSYS